MEKYYTPELEEFHVGFEFESNYILFRKGNKGDEWNKHILTKENTWFWDAYENDAIETEFRVKYLDTEDIESFGWKRSSLLTSRRYSTVYFIESKPSYAHWTLEVTNLAKMKEDGKLSSDKEEINDVHIKFFHPDDASGQTVFFGTIKNKSELNKLLKQLGI